MRWFKDDHATRFSNRLQEFLHPKDRETMKWHAIYWVLVVWRWMHWPFDRWVRLGYIPLREFLARLKCDPEMRIELERAKEELHWKPCTHDDPSWCTDECIPPWKRDQAP